MESHCAHAAVETTRLAGDWLIIKGVGYGTSLLPKSLHTNDLSALSPDRRCLVIISI